MQRSKKQRERYCNCDKPYDSTGFMIQCERCDIWYHGKCVGIKTKKQGDLIDHFFCEGCIKKSKNGRCENPDCLNEARGEISIDVGGMKKVKSKYCSDACGEQLNRLRYERFFKPKFRELTKKDSEARTNRVAEMQRVQEEISQAHENIGELKKKREELENVIAALKSEAARLRAANQKSPENDCDKESDENESEDEDPGEKQERVEQAKTYCITCGSEQAIDKAFKHWYQCHKKQESQWNYTSQLKQELSEPEDPTPRLLCEKECEKKGSTVRYCMNLAVACPNHSNWQPTKDEVCGCPLKVMQNLEMDGNYCLELKSECLQHYNWDRFRLARIDIDRLQEFDRINVLKQKSSQLTTSLSNSYGGVVGVMLHNTIDYERKLISEEEDEDAKMMVDVE